MQFPLEYEKNRQRQISVATLIFLISLIREYEPQFQLWDLTFIFSCRQHARRERLAALRDGRAHLSAPFITEKLLLAPSGKSRRSRGARSGDDSHIGGPTPEQIVFFLSRPQQCAFTIITSQDLVKPQLGPRLQETTAASTPRPHFHCIPP